MPKMPANNRMHSGSALKTHGVWANTIGYDPYAPTPKPEEQSGAGPSLNAYDNFKGLLALARDTRGSTGTALRGSCTKCGGVGHLTFQCRNHLKANSATDLDSISSTSSDSSDSDSEVEEVPPDAADKEKKEKERRHHREIERGHHGDEKDRDHGRHRDKKRSRSRSPRRSRSRSRDRSKSPDRKRDRSKSPKKKEVKKRRKRKKRKKKRKKKKEIKKRKEIRKRVKIKIKRNPGILINTINVIYISYVAPHLCKTFFVKINKKYVISD